MWGLSIVGSGGFLCHIHFGYWVSYLPCWLRAALFLLVNVVVSEYPEGLNLREQRVGSMDEPAPIIHGWSR